MQTHTPISVLVHTPATEAGIRELRRRVAGVHADFILTAIQTQTCPTRQKLELLQSVMDTAKGLEQAPDPIR